MSEMFNLNILGAYLWAFWAYIAKFGKLSKLGFKNLTFSWDCYPFFGHSFVTVFQWSQEILSQFFQWS